MTMVTEYMAMKPVWAGWVAALDRFDNLTHIWLGIFEVGWNLQVVTTDGFHCYTNTTNNDATEKYFYKLHYMSIYTSLRM